MIMPSCETCGTAIPYPFTCKFCGGTFCSMHRLPEAHECQFLPDRRISAPHEVSEVRASEAISPPEDREPLPYTEKLSRIGDHESKRRLRIVVALCVLLIAMPIIAGYFSYGLGYDTGYNSTSVSSYNAGYYEGNASGYELGCNVGFAQGNSSGFEGGNSSGYETGYNVGYTKGLNDGAGHGYNIRDPTYEEMMNFIASDQTNKNQYNSSYVCWNFAADVINNAFEAGYRCGFVNIELSNSGHAIVCFNTIGHGIVFIEPQNDNVVTLTIGQPYNAGSGFLPTSDTIVRYAIIW